MGGAHRLEDYASGSHVGESDLRSNVEKERALWWIQRLKLFRRDMDLGWNLLESCLEESTAFARASRDVVRPESEKNRHLRRRRPRHAHRSRHAIQRHAVVRRQRLDTNQPIRRYAAA